MMKSNQAESGRSQFEDNLKTIQEVVRRVAYRSRRSTEEAEDFSSYAHLRLLEDDCAVLRRFCGRSSLSTYLLTVVQRFLCDYRIQQWGKWRPSSRARGMGYEAELFERLRDRDGFSYGEAFEMIARNSDSRLPRRKLEALVARLPSRPRRPSITSAGPELERATPSTPSALPAGERARTLRAAAEALREALAELGEADRTLLRLRFHDEWTVARIGGYLGVPAKPLYGRIERSLARIRRTLSRRGLCWCDLSPLLGDDEVAARVRFPLNGPDLWMTSTTG